MERLSRVKAIIGTNPRIEIYWEIISNVDPRSVVVQRM